MAMTHKHEVKVTSARTFLLEGPLMTTIERRKAVAECMAKDLIRIGALGSEQAAIRALLGCDYSMVDVAILAGEARMLAYQEIVAAEMSKP